MAKKKVKTVKGHYALLTDANQEVITKYLSVPGAKVEDACRAAGITRDCFYKWLKRGRQESAELPDNFDKSPLYQNFLNAVEKAYSLQKLRLVNNIYSDEKGWQRFAWLLERRWPDEYGLKAKSQVDITSKGNEIKPPINIQVVDLETKDLLLQVQNGVRTSLENNGDIQAKPESLLPGETPKPQ